MQKRVRVHEHELRDLPLRLDLPVREVERGVRVMRERRHRRPPELKEQGRPACDQITCLHRQSFTCTWGAGI